ncbi:glycosyltransferase family 2 protein [Aquiflexum gelatinilyticum]|uniref:Glycosyltransferase family 2 protein n=1 Tax=Aquiflexum gelatinilyticum TaxID=2961943 RepID=A0A9X2P5M2_9BACT|nr:glycosyltransferase [Aquiflexum gelatinilyticum]MCR9014728.1 glycosyltransferase family 2 protein [Aquiflexum gelatinilyticum]
MYNLLLDILVDIFGILFLVYSFSIILFYLTMTVLSALEMRDHLKKNKFADYRDVITSPVTPGISVIAPAYNEGQNIVQNAKSLLTLHYGKYEVIIVNDGSKDDSLQKMIESFDLVKTKYAYYKHVETGNIRGVYKSTNSSYAKLTLVDKENGGKADALNAGINIAGFEILACIDVDCILSSDSLTRMVRPFMEETNRKVIAVGGVIGVANNCQVKDGTVTEYRVPETLLGRFQVIEYFRAFLMGRMAWTRINGLMLISGAFGFFNKDLVLKVGGYFPKTVGEDMELVVRMRRYMEETGQKYKVGFVPDPLCWTEVPESENILSKQRNRWMRGTIETLQLHKKVKLNPKYGVLGLVSYPYWSIFEKAGPIIEMAGFLYTTLMIFKGDISALYFIGLFVLMYVFSVMISSFSILYEGVAYNNYKDKADLNKLMRTVLLEPFLIHPKIVLWGLKGHWHFIKGKGGWGEMIRTGFKKAEDKKKINSPIQLQ